MYYIDDEEHSESMNNWCMAFKNDYDHHNKNDNEKTDNKRFKKLASMLLVMF